MQPRAREVGRMEGKTEGVAVSHPGRSVALRFPQMECASPLYSCCFFFPPTAGLTRSFMSDKAEGDGTSSFLASIADLRNEPYIAAG